MRGPAHASKIRMYHTLVVAPAFLAIFTVGPRPPFKNKTARHTEYLPRVQFHMIDRSRLPPRRSTGRAGALSVGSYALPNSLAVCCLYHRLHNGVCGDGNIGPLIHWDGAARAP
jgi:hypothetical protein